MVDRSPTITLVQPDNPLLSAASISFLTLLVRMRVPGVVDDHFQLLTSAMHPRKAATWQRHQIRRVHVKKG